MQRKEFFARDLADFCESVVRIRWEENGCRKVYVAELIDDNGSDFERGTFLWWQIEGGGVGRPNVKIRRMCDPGPELILAKVTLSEK